MPVNPLTDIWSSETVKCLLELGATKTSIAKRFGKSRQAVYDLLAKETPATPDRVNGLADRGKGGPNSS